MKPDEIIHLKKGDKRYNTKVEVSSDKNYHHRMFVDDNNPQFKKPTGWWHDIWIELNKLYQIKNNNEKKGEIICKINDLIAELLDNKYIVNKQPKIDWVKDLMRVWVNVFGIRTLDPDHRDYDNFEVIKQFITDQKEKSYKDGHLNGYVDACAELKRRKKKADDHLIDDLVNEIFVAKDGVLGLRDIFIKSTEIGKIRRLLKEKYDPK